MRRKQAVPPNKLVIVMDKIVCSECGFEHFEFFTTIEERNSWKCSYPENHGDGTEDDIPLMV